MKQCFLFILVCYTNLSIAQANNTVYVPYNLNHKWGFADTNGLILIKPLFDSVGLFDKGYANAYKNDKVGMINTKGRWVVPPTYKFVELLDRKLRLFEVTIDKKEPNGDYTCYRGIYQEVNGLIAPIKYAYFDQYNADNFVMAGYGKNYLLNVKTRSISVFPHKHYFNCGCAVFQKRMQRNEKKRMQEEERVKKYLSTKPPLESIGKLNLIKSNGKIGGYIVYDTLFDKKRNRWIKYVDSFLAIYDTIIAVDDDNEKFYINLNDKWGVLNAKGRIIISPEYSRITLKIFGISSDKYFIVKKDEKLGIMSFNGIGIVPCLQDSIVIECGYMSCFFSALKNGKWAVINNKGLFVTDYLSDESVVLDYWADHYKYMVIKQDNKFGLIDTTGKLVHPALYDEINILHGDGFMITRNGKFYGVKKLSNPKEGLETYWDTVRKVEFPLHFRLLKNNQQGVYDAFKESAGRRLYFPIGNDPYFSLEHCISANGKVQFAVFGFEKDDKYYYIGENGIRFTKD